MQFSDYQKSVAGVVLHLSANSPTVAAHLVLVVLVVVVSYILWLTGIESSACTRKGYTPVIYQAVLFSSSSQYKTFTCMQKFKQNEQHILTQQAVSYFHLVFSTTYFILWSLISFALAVQRRSCSCSCCCFILFGQEE
jgi:hypothetical protein